MLIWVGLGRVVEGRGGEDRGGECCRFCFSGFYLFFVVDFVRFWLFFVMFVIGFRVFVDVGIGFR